MTRFKMILLATILLGLIMLLWSPSKKIGQIINEAYSCHNGICDWAYRVNMLGGTSTPCSVRSPEATSTLIHGSAVLNLPATSTHFMEMGIADNNNSTSSRIFATSTGANLKGSVAATSTLNTIIPPNSFINLRFGTPAGISKGSVGVCEVIFRVL